MSPPRVPQITGVKPADVIFEEETSERFLRLCRGTVNVSVMSIKNKELRVARNVSIPQMKRIFLELELWGGFYSNKK